MADKDFRIDLILGAKFAEGFRALDQAKRKLESVEGAAGKFSRGAGTAVGTSLRLAGMAGIAAASAATAVMGLYIAKTIEAEKVQAQLQARLKDTGSVAGRTLAQLNEQSKGLSRITVFDDEAIGQAQAMLLTFTQIRGQNFDKTVESALNLATVMGTDTTSAAKLLGRALSDPEKGLSALTRAGVVFTDAERKKIETMLEAGQIAEAQGVILEKLSGTMGTAATAARDTLGGAMQALKNAFDDLMEGDSGDSGVVGTRAAIESLISTLNDPATKQGFDNLVNSLVKVAQVAIKATSEVANFTRFVAEEVASRVSGPASDDTVRIEQAIERQQRLLDQLDQKGTGAERRNTSAYATAQRAELKRLQDMLKAATTDRDQAEADNFAKYRGLPKDWGLNFNQNPSNPKPDGQGVATLGKPKPGSKTDPDADIKRRIESLREEAALLGMVEKGEDEASEAAKARYAITEGEFKKKSPQLKAELLAAAEALDAKNKDTDAEKKRLEAIEESQKAYAELMADLRTPAQVAVDEAIAKLNTLTAAMNRGDTNGVQLHADQAKIIKAAFERAPDNGFGQYNPFDRLEEQRLELEAWYSSQLSTLAAFRQQRADLNAQWNAQEELIEAQHQAALQQLQVAQSQLMLGAASSMFGSLADIARAGAGEQSKAYQGLFALSKGFAVAQAAVALAQNVAEASKIGWPQNIPAIAAAFAQGAQIASILAGANYSPAGYAGGGRIVGPGTPTSDSVPIWASRDEHMIRASSAMQPGARDFLDAFNERGMPALWDWVRGYAAGGHIGAPSPRLASPDYASFPQGANGLAGELSNNMNLYLFQDIDRLAQAVANHPANRKMVLAEVSENGEAIRASWGG